MSTDATPPESKSSWIARLYRSSPAKAGTTSASQRIISRTADILVISLVLVIGLTMGREVLRWWGSDSPPVSPKPAKTPAWGEAGQPVELEFGESPLALTRQTFEGDRQAVRNLLLDRCRANAIALGESRLGTLQTLVSAADEQETVRKLLARKPIAGDESWQVHRLEGPFEMTIALRRAPKLAASATEDQWRIVAWGTAMPLGPTTWAVHTYAAGPSGRKIAGLPPPTAPPGSRRLVGMSETRGGSLVGFMGGGPADDWTRYYDGWFAGHGWTGPDWNTSESHRSKRFRPKSGTGVADVQLVQDGQTWRGIVSVMDGE